MKLLFSAVRRLVTAVTSPFRLIWVKFLRLFNTNILTAKLVSPLTKKVRSLVSLKPQSKQDYIPIGKHWVYKKLFLTIVLVLCACVFLYFTMFAQKVETPSMVPTAVKTDVVFMYNDMKLKDFIGIANITAQDMSMVYTGEINKGVCQGEGRLWNRKGQLVYEGAFDKNRYNGKGIAYENEKKKYVGDFVDNQFTGQGQMFDENGKLIYEGQFLNSQYSGAGKLYSEEGILLYEGGFLNNKFHGTGTVYYADGTIRSVGEFFEGAAQGSGTLYSSRGKLLYTGAMHADNINYQSLIGASMAEIETAFAESPRVFYSDTNSAFVFEQAGIILTANCRVKVDVWEKQNMQEDSLSKFYYMPSELESKAEEEFDIEPFESDSAISTMSSSRKSPVSNAVQTKLKYAAGKVSGHNSIPYAIPITPFLQGKEIQKVATSWYAANENSSIENLEILSSSSDEITQRSPSMSMSQSGIETGDPSVPDFINKKITIYYEIDSNVWRSEQDPEWEKDKKRIVISKVTVFNHPLRGIPKGMKEFTDNQPPYLEDCVAIDFIRQQKPTAFGDVVFELDKQNKMFVYLMKVNYADSVGRRAYSGQGLIWRVYHQRNSTDIEYFSIENEMG